MLNQYAKSLSKNTLLYVFLVLVMTGCTTTSVSKENDKSNENPNRPGIHGS